MSTVDALSAITTALGGVRSAASATADHVEQQTKRIADATEKATREGGTKLDDFIFQLEQKIKMGDDLAQSVLDIVNQVQEGALSVTEAMKGFTGLNSTLTGELRTISGLLAEVLPSSGEVQRSIRETIAGVQDYGQAVALLRDQNNTLARTFADMVEAFRAGRLSLDQLLRTAQDLQRALPGSETAALAKLLSDAAREGTL